MPGQAAVGGQATVAATMALGDGSVHAMRADMDVQQGSSSLTVVRWISRGLIRRLLRGPDIQEPHSQH